MGFSQKISSTDILAAVTSDSIKWKGADLDAAISTSYLGEYWFWAQPTEVCTIDATTDDYPLESLTLPNWSPTIKAAYAMLEVSYYRELAGTSNYVWNTWLAANMSALGYVNCVRLKDNWIKPDANQIGALGMTFHGSVDISSRCAWNTQTQFLLNDTRSNSASIAIYGVRPGLRILI